jgi:multiple sugar transport system substrate-binding protein
MPTPSGTIEVAPLIQVPRSTFEAAEVSCGTTGGGGPAVRRQWARLRRAARATAAGAGSLVRSNLRQLSTFVVGVLVGVLLSTLAANGWPFVGEAEGDLGDDTLVVLSGADDSPRGEHERLIRTWNALHPDLPARIVPVSSNADNAHADMRTAAQSSEPDVDVFNLDVVWMAEFAENGWIRPLEDVDTTGFLAKPLDTCRYEGRLWGLPFNTDAGLLYYRAPQLIEHGIDPDRADLTATPPRSWDTIARLIDTAFVAERPAGDPLRAGYTAQFDDYEGLTVNAMEAIWAGEGEVVDDEGTVRLDSAAAGDALRQLGDAYRTPRDVLPGSGSFQESQSRDAFGARQVLFMRNWPLAYRQLTTPADERAGGATASTAPHDISVTRLPGPSALGGQNLAVASESRHPEAARQLVEFLTSEASQQILFQDGGFAATRQRIYEDPYIRQNYGYAALLLESVKNAKLRPVTPYYARFSAEFRRVVLNVLRTGDDVSANDVRKLQDALAGK